MKNALQLAPQPVKNLALDVTTTEFPENWKADNTQRAYLADIKDFLRWCQSRDVRAATSRACERGQLFELFGVG